MMKTGVILDGISGDQLILEEGKNLFIDFSPFASLGVVDSLDSDLVRVASYIFAADLAIARLDCEQHLRTITLTVPVVNFDAFERLRPIIEDALTILSHDNWTLRFVREDGDAARRNKEWPAKQDATLMFSGGLDSFCGAAHLLSSSESLTLVSHITHNHDVKSAQANLAAIVKKTFESSVDHLQVLVHGRNFKEFDFPADREVTQRTRSFLFVALAAVAAHLSGSRRIIVMAENGQFAIHLPLSEARIGSFSTHTAHPEFLKAMQQILRELYACPDLEVTNPFLYFTKGEVVAALPDSLRPAIVNSTSCWKASRVKESLCGECVPCLSRRIALEFHGIHIKEYHRDLLIEKIGDIDAKDNGKRNLVDMCQFISMFQGPQALISDEELAMTVPELLNDALEFDKAVGMYRRFAAEAIEVFRRYPHVASLLS